MKKCTNDACGPFEISRAYWNEAGNFTEGSLVEGSDGFEACAKTIPCASKIVTRYLMNHARDCNQDQIVDCADYARLHMFGEAKCRTGSLASPNFNLNKFNECINLESSTVSYVELYNVRNKKIPSR